MKNEKKLHGFSYVKSMANSEAFDWNFLSSTNPQIVRSGPVLGMSPPTVLKTDFYLHQKQLIIFSKTSGILKLPQKSMYAQSLNAKRNEVKVTCC